jgi:NuA3 HAT complex component NTO1
LEAALKVEADLSKKPLDILFKELEGMLEASLETSQRTITVAEDGHDVAMADAPEEGQIIVAGRANGDAGMAAETGHDADGGAGVSETADAHAEQLVDKMDVDGSPHRTNGHADVNMSELDEAGKNEAPPALPSASVSIAGDGLVHPKPEQIPDGVNDSSASPSLNGYPTVVQPPHQAGPLTPPQSNGSVGHGTAATDALSEGGLPWYLKGFSLVGTTATEEQQWAVGREAVRSPSEELTDLDDEALRDLEFEVDDDTINASPPVNAAGTTHLTPASASRKRANPAKFRKGLRSSARKR